MNIRTIDWNDAREVDEFMEELDGYRAHMHAASQFGTDGIGAFIGDGNGVPSIDAVAPNRHSTTSTARARRTIPTATTRRDSVNSSSPC